MFILDDYKFVFFFFFISCLIPVLALSTSRFLRPQGCGPERRTTYESGIEPMGESRIQFTIRYYMFALIFVLFDVETLFLYPWAVTFNELGLAAFLEAFLFISILVLGLVYAWRKGALEWS
jgi:NAD(P)H-quinone oxidoreductase subunit 3